MLGDPAKPEPDLTGVPKPGDTVAGLYLIEQRLGVGGMGAVMRARRIRDGAPVAMKVMLAEEAQHADSTKRFFREARAVGSIKSPHVTQLLDLGRLDDGMPFMVLELLHGQPLDSVIEQEAPMPIEVAVDYVLQACEGVAHAHALRVIHRDLKPSNLFRALTPLGVVVKVLDFGISKASMRLEPGSDQKSLTETNTTLGSPQYMSPEQLRSSKDVDARTDVWSLGLILYKLLTGMPAFEATTVGEHFAMIFADPPKLLRGRRPDAPERLERAILMCLQRDLDKRFGDVAQLAMAIAPHGPRGSAARAARISAILEQAGVSSGTGPRLPLEGPSESQRDAPTVRIGPASSPPAPASSPPSSPPISSPPWVPPAPFGAGRDMTTSHWSSLSKSAPAPEMSPPRVPWAAAALIAVLCAAAATSFILFSDKDANVRATAAFAQAIDALLPLPEDAIEQAPPDTSTEAEADPPVVEKPDKPGARRKHAAPAPKEAPPEPAPASKPTEPSEIKPKGPMEETL